MEQFRRFETPTMEFMNGPTVPSESQYAVVHESDKKY